MRRYLAQSAAVALALTAALAGVPLLVAVKTDFLGADMSSVASGVVQFYPWVAAAEVGKVLGAAWLLALLVVIAQRAIAARLGVTRGRWLAWAFGAPALAYALWLTAAVLHYPALFDSYLGNGLGKLVFWASFRLRPMALEIAALLVLCIGPVAVLATRARARAAKNEARGSSVAAAAVLCTAGVAAVLSGGVTPLPHAPQARADGGKRPPNVLLIAVDSLRHDRLARAEVTPTLQALAADPQTVAFDSEWVGIPRTFPSWIEMLQGRKAPHTGVRHMFPGFEARKHEFVGLGTTLRDAGYRTAAVSDFAGDIFPRFQAGFDTIDAPKLTLMTMIRMSTDELFPAFLPLITSRLGVALFPDLKESPTFADPVHLTDKALAQIAADDGRPLFLTTFYSTAHFPYAAPHPYYSLFSDRGYAGPFRFQKNPDLASSTIADDESAVRQVRALYDGAVRGVDDQLGRLFAALKASGAWDDTLIVVTADHGEDLFEPGVQQGHGEHLRGENVLHVPLLMKLPAGTAVATHGIGFATRSIDLAPTIADAVGRPLAGADGQSLMPWVRGEQQADPALPVYAETGIWFARTGAGFYQKKRMDYPGISGLLAFDQGYTGEIVLNPLYEGLIVSAKHRMLMVGDRKLIYMPTRHGIEYELYDQRADPANQHDLSAQEPQTLERMKAQLLAMIAAQEPPASYRMADDFVVPR